MRKSSILLTIAIVFATLSLTGKALAQRSSSGNSSRVWLTYDSWKGYFNQVGFVVTLYNNSSGNFYYLETMTPQYWEPTTYRLGSVPSGNYRLLVNLKLSHSFNNLLYFNWWAANQSGNYVFITSTTETLFTDDIEVEYDDWGNDPGLHIHITDN